MRSIFFGRNQDFNLNNLDSSDFRSVLDSLRRVKKVPSFCLMETGVSSETAGVVVVCVDGVLVSIGWKSTGESLDTGWRSSGSESAEISSHSFKSLSEKLMSNFTSTTISNY